MKFKTLSMVGALLVAMAVPSFALAGGRYHSAGSGRYDRGSRYDRGQPYRSSSYHGRGYDHNYGHDYHHKSHSNFSFSFGFGSYYPVYREPVYVRSYYYEPVYVPAPVYVAPRYSYDYDSCYSRPSNYYYRGEVRYYYGR